jgi:NaMN:DMB phosphoribosyltransferase
MATAFALNYNVRDKFSSSFSDAPKSIKENIVKKALNNISKDDDIFSILGKVSDNMLIFNSGFILGVDGRFPILLAGGTQMASVLLIINRLLEIMDGEIDSSKFALTTTKWIAEDNSSDIKSLLEMCKFNINSYYSDFNFSSSTHPALKLYDKGEAKEGVGAGGSLIYGFLNGLNQKDIIKQIEKLLI